MPQIRTKKISADEARAKRQDHVKEVGGSFAVLKAFRAPPSWDKETRTARMVMTTQTVDRYGDIVVTAGAVTDAFEQNPVALLCHNSRDWPIGQWANMEKILKGRPPRMEGDLVLLPEGGPVPEVDQAAWMIDQGAIRACSIGFVPDWDNIEMILDDEGKWTGGLQFNQWELIECSLCPVPANPQALAKMVDGNMKLAKELVEEVLDGFARTPAGLLVARKDYERTYRTIVEEIKTPAAPPSTDAEIAEAELRSIEFEVAKLVPAFKDATAAVDGAVKAKLQVVDGKWKHVGEHQDGDVVNFCIVCAEKDGKRSFEPTTIVDSRLPRVKRCGMAWKDDVEGAGFGVTVNNLAGDAVSVESVVDENGHTTIKIAEKAAPPAPDGKVTVTLGIDPAAKAELESEMSSFMSSLREKVSKLFRVSEKQSPQDRVEPALETPAPPSAEEIAAMRERVAATRERLASKGLV